MKELTEAGKRERGRWVSRSEGTKMAKEKKRLSNGGIVNSGG